MLKKLVIVIVVVIGLLGGYLGLAFVVRWVNTFNRPDAINLDYIKNSKENRNDTSSVNSNLDQTLLGNWDTGCLVPDPNSPWAERHTFIFNASGTGRHTRFSGDSCAALTADNIDDFTAEVPSKGQVNLTYTNGAAQGLTLFDIYQTTKTTLKFGHGFCNCVSKSGKFGASEGDRFIELNKFLLYRRSK